MEAIRCQSSGEREKALSATISVNPEDPEGALKVLELVCDQVQANGPTHRAIAAAIETLRRVSIEHTRFYPVIACPNCRHSIRTTDALEAPGAPFAEAGGYCQNPEHTGKHFKSEYCRDFYLLKIEHLPPPAPGPVT